MLTKDNLQCIRNLKEKQNQIQKQKSGTKAGSLGRGYRIILQTAMLYLLLYLVAIPAEASEITKKAAVYTSMTNSVSYASGDGTKENPYNRFEDALANVSEGGTIYILGSNNAFINARENDLPFVFDKAVTVEPEPGADRAILVSRAAGMVLGADVTLKNIELDFAFPYHDQICANGYRLILENVSRNSGHRLIDLVGGSLYDTDGERLGPEPGQNGQITVSGKKSEFGNLYAGSINGPFEGNVSICVEDAKGAVIGEVYGSGAKEAEYDRDNWFDLEEPPAPVPDSALYPVNGKVQVTIQNAPVRTVDGQGAVQGTSVIFGSLYRTDTLSLYNIMGLTVTEGILEPVVLTASDGMGLDFNIAADAALDLNKLGDINVNNFTGGGKVVLDINAVMKIAGNVTGETAFETNGGYNGYSGLALENHTYIQTAADSEGIFTFTPYPTQPYLKLVKQSDGKWNTVSDTDSTYVTIMYWTDNTAYGDVSRNWEMIDAAKGIPQGAAAEAKQGYHFVCWVDEEGREVGQKAVFIPEKVNGVYVDNVYEARFEANAYTIHFEANGGSGVMMPELQCTYGNSQSLTKNTYEKDGYIFKGWNVKQDGTGIRYGDQQEVTNLTTKENDDIILYAQWEKEESTEEKEEGSQGEKEDQADDNNQGGVSSQPVSGEQDAVPEHKEDSQGSVTPPSQNPSSYPPESKQLIHGSSYIDSSLKLRFVILKVGAKGGTVQCCGVTDKKIKKVMIPAAITINGTSYKVTAIAKNAFKNNKKLQKVTIGKNVSKIGQNAFRGCTKLKTTVIKTTKLTKGSVGKNAFAGSYAKMKVKVPKSKVKKYKKLLRSRGLSSRAKVSR